MARNMSVMVGTVTMASFTRVALQRTTGPNGSLAMSHVATALRHQKANRETIKRFLQLNPFGGVYQMIIDAEIAEMTRGASVSSRSVCGLRSLRPVE